MVYTNFNYSAVGRSSRTPLVRPNNVPAAAVPNPANVVTMEGATTATLIDWKAENKPPAAPPYIADCRHAAVPPGRHS